MSELKDASRSYALRDITHHKLQRDAFIYASLLIDG